MLVSLKLWYRRLSGARERYAGWQGRPGGRSPVVDDRVNSRCWLNNVMLEEPVLRKHDKWKIETKGTKIARAAKTILPERLDRLRFSPLMVL
ncbi:MAG: hypothetical protein GDA56_12010 [Hormoscilla sp. GM7CHS1pb]|nr:hypothetical protein [Hormoscilla sp. GM7CHS1pb]